MAPTFLPRALTASLAVHLLMLALPVGRGGWGGWGEVAAAGRRDWAPLQVALGVRSWQAPSRAVPGERQDSRPRPTAAAIAADEAGPGLAGLGGEAAVAVIEPPARGLALPEYFPQRELNPPARILGDIDLTLGPLRDVPGIGKAVVVLWINEHGVVDRAEVERSDLDPVFSQAVLAEFRSARFAPGRRDGVAVGSLMKLEVEILPRSRFAAVNDH